MDEATRFEIKIYCIFRLRNIRVQFTRISNDSGIDLISNDKKIIIQCKNVSILRKNVMYEFLGAVTAHKNKYNIESCM